MLPATSVSKEIFFFFQKEIFFFFFFFFFFLFFYIYNADMHNAFVNVAPRQLGAK